MSHVELGLPVSFDSNVPDGHRSRASVKASSRRIKRKWESGSNTDVSPYTSTAYTATQADTSASMLEGSEEDQTEHVKLEDQITNERLTRLQKTFEDASRHGIRIGLDMEEFASAMKESMGEKISERELEMLFMKVDTNCDGGVDWDEYLSYMLLEYREKDLMHAMQYEKPLPQSVRPILSPHRDTISRVAFMPILRNRQGYVIEKMDFAHGRYISVSRDGVVNFWNNEMQHVKVAQMESKKAAIISNWVTDLVTMPNVNMVAVSSTDGCISFYDVNANKFERYLTIWGLEQAPLTMDYSFDETNINYAVLIWGDAGGNVASCSLSQCLHGGPFGPPSGIRGSQRRISFASLLHGKIPSVRAFILRKLHNDWVISVRYYQWTGFFVSCCQDDETAMYTGDLEARKITSYFKLRKGIICFDYCKNLNILVTGGLDHMIRVWNPYVTAKAILILKGHNKAIVHLIVHQEKELIISLAKDNAIRVFDLKDQSCVQHIPGKLTPIGNSISINCVYFNPKSENLILATSHLCIYERKATEIVVQPTSHDAPVTAALYNPVFDVIVSGCYESLVNVWSVTTGEKIIQFRKAHKKIVDCTEEGIEITAMCFDNTYRRLITGAQDGTVKVWNFNNGALLTELDRVDQKEVTGLAAPATRILVTGWNRRVVSHIDVKDEEDHPTFWPIKHTDDILGLEFYPPSIVATCSYGADIIIWSMETGHMVCRMNINDGIEPCRIVQQSVGLSDEDREAAKKLYASGGYTSSRGTPKLTPAKLAPRVLPDVSARSAVTVNRTSSLNGKSGPDGLCRQCGGTRKPDVGQSSSHKNKTSNLEIPSLVGQCECPQSQDQLSNSLSKPLSRKKIKSIISPKSYRKSLRNRASRSKKARPDDFDKPARRCIAPNVVCDAELNLGEVSSIDKILFLKGRTICKETATLFAGGADGWVQAWSIHHQGFLLGQFSASRNPGESVCALATDDNHQWLITGDTKGYIRVWDISLYCIKLDKSDVQRIKKERHRVYNKFKHLSVCSEAFEILQPKFANHTVPPPRSKPEITLKMPPLLSSWRGHLQSLTSLYFIQPREVIVSSGLDGIIRLWHYTGRYIGTFGQSNFWNIPADVPCKSHYLRPIIPTDLRPCVSGCSIRCMTGRIHKQWKLALNVILFLIKTVNTMDEKGKPVGSLRLPELCDYRAAAEAKKDGKLHATFHADTYEDKSVGGAKLEPITYDKIMKSVVKSDILGLSYTKTRRHRPFPILPKIKSFQHQLIVFASLPFSNLDPLREYKPSEMVQDLMNRNQPAPQPTCETARVKRTKRTSRWRTHHRSSSPKLSPSPSQLRLRNRQSPKSRAKEGSLKVTREGKSPSP